MHGYFIVTVLFLCKNLSMKKQQMYAIPVEDTDKLLWVKETRTNHIIFKAISIRDVQENKSKSGKQSSR